MEKLFILTLISFELPYFCFDTPLRFWPLLKREGIYRKKLDVITFPLSSSSRGYRRFNGRTTSSKQKALVCPKTAKRAKLNYTYRSWNQVKRCGTTHHVNPTKVSVWDNFRLLACSISNIALHHYQYVPAFLCRSPLELNISFTKSVL